MSSCFVGVLLWKRRCLLLFSLLEKKKTMTILIF
jgi:hypothetical protein